MSASEQASNDIKEQLKLLVSKKRHDKIMKILKRNLKNPDINFSEFYDLIGELFLEDPEFYMEDLYRKIHLRMRKILSTPQVYEMELKLVEKLSLYEGENFITSFDGEISVSGTFIKGKIYLTNYRMITHGILRVPPQTTQRQQHAVMEDLAHMGEVVMEDLAHMEGIHKVMTKSAQEIKHCFGYQFPIINSSKIKRKRSSIRYRATGFYDEKEKTRKAKVIVGVQPQKPKGVKPKEWLPKMDEILTVLEQTISP